MRNGRLEALTDGVIAVAITLLVLDLHLEDHSSKDFAEQLRERWPSFAAYVVSFSVIAAIWLAHYHLFRLATDVDDHVLITCSFLLLFFITTIPFTTAAYAGYLLEGSDNARLAVIVYGSVMVGVAVSLMSIFERLVRAGLTGDNVSPQQAKRMRMLFLLRTAMYLLIMAVGFINPLLMPVLYIVTDGILHRPSMRAMTPGALPEKQS